MSLVVTGIGLVTALGEDAAFVARAHCSLAASIKRRLLMHALIRDVVLACTKFGTAIAANRPIMATTIMISTSVKPLRFLIIFIMGISPLVR